MRPTVLQKAVDDQISLVVLVILRDPWEHCLMLALLVYFGLVIAHTLPPQPIFLALTNLVLQLCPQDSPLFFFFLFLLLFLLCELLLYGYDLVIFLLKILVVVHLFPHLFLDEAVVVEVARLDRLQMLLLTHTRLAVLVDSGGLQFLKEVLVFILFEFVNLLDQIVRFWILVIAVPNLIDMLRM